MDTMHSNCVTCHAPTFTEWDQCSSVYVGSNACTAYLSQARLSLIEPPTNLCPGVKLVHGYRDYGFNLSVGIVQIFTASNGCFMQLHSFTFCTYLQLSLKYNASWCSFPNQCLQYQFRPMFHRCSTQWKLPNSPPDLLYITFIQVII